MCARACARRCLPPLRKPAKEPLRHLAHRLCFPTSLNSIAILLYLTRKFQTPDHWYPSDLQERARVDEYLSWQHMDTRMAGSKVYLAQVSKGKEQGKGAFLARLLCPRGEMPAETTLLPASGQAGCRLEGCAGTWTPWKPTCHQ